MILSAKYALTAPGQVRTNVRLEVDGNRITSLSSGYVPGALVPDHDFGTAVITPGLVNPHSHLELEFCQDQVPFNGDFFDWLQAIRDLKRERGNRATSFPQASLRDLLASGCTTVVDHHTTQLDWQAVEGFGLRYVPLREFFQFNNHQPELDAMRRLARRGYAAHAPYTASIEVARACRQLALECGLPLSMHLSEIPEEIRFVRDGDCERIAKLLRTADSYDDAFRGTGKSPVHLYADQGLLSGPTYAIHLNYLDEGDLDLLADIKPTVIYCPRSHEFFKHAKYPLERYLTAQIPVAFGTDSLASNSRLSPLHEAALVRRVHPQVGAAQVFAAITTQALKPLDWDRHLGRLEPGYLADIAVFVLPADPGAEFVSLLDAIIERGLADLTMVDGMVRHSAVPGVGIADA